MPYRKLTEKETMNQIELNKKLKEVIEQAQEIKIPVSSDIYEKVIINPRPQKRYGCCKYKNGVNYIEISEFILKCEPEKIQGVLAHEVLHTCSGCRNHGNIWKKYAMMMNRAYGYNIKRTSSMEEMGLQTEQKDTESTGKEESPGKRESTRSTGKEESRKENRGGRGSKDSKGERGGGKSGTGSGYEREKIKYLVKCRKCGREFPRKRRSAVTENPKAYRCQCGGELNVYEVVYKTIYKTIYKTKL